MSFDTDLDRAGRHAAICEQFASSVLVTSQRTGSVKTASRTKWLGRVPQARSATPPSGWFTIHDCGLENPRRLSQTVPARPAASVESRSRSTELTPTSVRFTATHRIACQDARAYRRTPARWSSGHHDGMASTNARQHGRRLPAADERTERSSSVAPPPSARSRGKLESS